MVCIDAIGNCSAYARASGGPGLRIGLRIVLLAAAGFLSCGLVPERTAAAETLGQAMQSALAHHPKLMAEAARERAARAGIDVARSGYFPRIHAAGDLGASSGRQGLNAGAADRTGVASAQAFDRGWGGAWGASVSAEQPIFDGNRTSSAVAEARSSATAARAQVSVAEQSVLLEAVTVFADVLTDRRIEALRQSNVVALNTAMQAAVQRDRSRAGTRTDVVQAKARREQAVADLIAARAQTQASIAEYARVIGRKPGDLTRPHAPVSLLPKSREHSVTTAMAANPATLVALGREAASRHAIDKLNADRLPQIKLRGGLETDRRITGQSGDSSSGSVSLRVVVPLYDGGETQSRVRQARQLNASLMEDARDVRDRVRSGAEAAWARHAAARERIISERRAVAANREALEGIREGIRLGQRSILEGLDAQREMVAAQVRLETGERDVIVSAYALLAATGRLTASTPAEGKGAAKGIATTAATVSSAPRRDWSSVTRVERADDEVNVGHQQRASTGRAAWRTLVRVPARP